jgi:hypothetical protein
MRRRRPIGVAVGLLAVCGAVALAWVRVHAAHADPQDLVRDFYGEADEEVTAVAAAPTGMVCGGLSIGSGLLVETTEPPTGFTGACLMNRPYGASLPTVCYSPANANYSGPGTVQCTIPAANVVQPSWHIGVSPEGGTVTRQYLNESYRVLETCAPHVAGDCGANMAPVSHSCCTHYGTAMTSNDDGKTAIGTAYFTHQ